MACKVSSRGSWAVRCEFPAELYDAAIDPRNPRRGDAYDKLIGRYRTRCKTVFRGGSPPYRIEWNTANDFEMKLEARYRRIPTRKYRRKKPGPTVTSAPEPTKPQPPDTLF